MWISKITTCFLVPAWAVVATSAFVPVSAFHHHSGATASSSKHNVASLPNSRRPNYRGLEPSSRRKRLSRKTVEDDNNEATTSSSDAVPRGGGTSVVNDKPPPQPTLADYRKFAIPCLGLWVAQPLLSLVDTAFVGLSARVPAESAAQLAALGPATTFFDGATYLFAFLNVATTNLYSTARAQRGEQSDQAEAVVRTASRVATRCGIGIMLFLLAFARPLLGLYIGHGTDAALLDSAVDYVKIRAFSMPTSLLLGVVQAALLGAKDSVTPLIAILYSTVVNIVGDFFLVRVAGMGLRGAAIATLAAQLAATAALLGPARTRLVRDRSLGLWKKKASPVNGAGDDGSLVNSKAFLGFAAPVLTLILGKLAAFGFMTHSAAAVPGQPTPLASHQIILSLFFFVSPFMEVISQTAQTFVPPYLAPVNEYVAGGGSEDDSIAKPWLDTAFSLGTSLLKLGFMSATVVASLASLIPAFFGGMLTSDPVVKNAVKPLAKYLWAGAFLTAPVAVSEGLLLARRELKYLAGIYLLTTALLPPALLRIKDVGGSVEQVWACFAVFQLVRAGFFAGRIWSGSVLRAIMGLFGGKGGSSTKAPEPPVPPPAEATN
mmetsp:Transcript_24312/g.53530  ORF Transcript_24312/g.53530 Transcript_24312/m.53530 type:complete len:604 (+) Transcript_24312:76-1887(+)|eukprot:CAMPEP_0201138626 /NCGR_PEP_ID=MMETSP0850-20130426/56024_1 /ASSEMBLY_ACC=CAM_ASM_000622 /TAXON_ID=183588 /ORGANISM="Pseudo-nitzschia fraudulenta, Strain WWA7" /LENGTH=603 /DNA_ID=CAMNT_0047410021 /DNA_START=73 /DNA_END=1884 /DNA_ORIENTATION=+